MRIMSWSPIDYNKGEVVFYNGAYYQAESATRSAPDTRDWCKLGSLQQGSIPTAVWMTRPKTCRPQFLKWWIDLQERYYRTKLLAPRMKPGKPISVR